MASRLGVAFLFSEEASRPSGPCIATSIASLVDPPHTIDPAHCGVDTCARTCWTHHPSCLVRAPMWFSPPSCLRLTAPSPSSSSCGHRGPLLAHRHRYPPPCSLGLAFHPPQRTRYTPRTGHAILTCSAGFFLSSAAEKHSCYSVLGGRNIPGSSCLGCLI